MAVEALKSPRPIDTGVFTGVETLWSGASSFSPTAATSTVAVALSQTVSPEMTPQASNWKLSTPVNPLAGV